MTLLFSAIIKVLYSNNFENLKNHPQFLLFVRKKMALKPEQCDSRDLFVLENSLKELIQVISLISRPHQVTAAIK